MNDGEKVLAFIAIIVAAAFVINNLGLGSVVGTQLYGFAGEVIEVNPQFNPVCSWLSGDATKPTRILAELSAPNGVLYQNFFQQNKAPSMIVNPTFIWPNQLPPDCTSVTPKVTFVVPELPLGSYDLRFSAVPDSVNANILFDHFVDYSSNYEAWYPRSDRPVFSYVHYVLNVTQKPLPTKIIFVEEPKGELTLDVGGKIELPFSIKNNGGSGSIQMLVGSEFSTEFVGGIIKEYPDPNAPINISFGETKNLTVVLDAKKPVVRQKVSVILRFSGVDLTKDIYVTVVAPFVLNECLNECCIGEINYKDKVCQKDFTCQQNKCVELTKSSESTPLTKEILIGAGAIILFLGVVLIWKK